MPSHNTTFNSNWCNKYTWVKVKPGNSYMALCTLCRSDISVANRGEGALQQHEKTNKHINAVTSAAKSVPISQHFKSMFQFFLNFIKLSKVSYSYFFVFSVIC